MKFIKLIIALAAFAFLAACSSTDDNGVTVSKKFLFFGSADTVQTDYQS